MIIQVYDKFLASDECTYLISFYEKNKDKSVSFKGENEGLQPRWPLNIIENWTEFIFLQNKLNQKSLYVNNSVLDYVQIVKWPIGSKQFSHYDVAHEHTTLASIIYLNDNFSGGETYFTDGMMFLPRQGRLILFDGQYFEHGVSDVNTNERYVVAAWYKKNSKKENDGQRRRT